jgi:hypothetical protein
MKERIGEEDRYERDECEECGGDICNGEESSRER